MAKKTDDPKPKSRSGTYVPDVDRVYKKLQVRPDKACAEAWKVVHRTDETQGATLRRLILEESARIQRKRR